MGGGFIKNDLRGGLHFCNKHPLWTYYFKGLFIEMENNGTPAPSKSEC